jgi:putative ATP-dependent endonuclease of the OLD family
MYINRLSIKNFRNFGDPPFEIVLRPFTLILGENNLGKTNLLAAVSLLFSQEIYIAQRRFLSIDGINYDAVAALKRQVADKGVPIQDVTFPEVIIDVRLTDMTGDQHPVIGDWYVDTQLKEAQVTYRFSIRSTFDKENWINEQRESLQRIRAVKGGQVDGAQLWQWVDFPTGEYRHMIYGAGHPSNECEAFLLRMLCVEILDALRDAERELTGGGDQRLLYRVLRQRSDTRYADLKERLLDLEEAIRSNAALSCIKDDVAKLLERVSLMTAGEDHSIDFHFSAPDATEMLKKIGMIYGANPITVARNGLGRNNLLYVALMLSQLAKTADPSPSNEDFVCFRFVGIEEPEAHLHPHLQDHLASNIEEIRREYSDSLQLLLTSHSTHIAAKLRLENTAEQTIIPALFEQSTGNTLEAIGCTILNVNGVAFRHFLMVVRNGFFKRCVVLTDQDTGTKAENRADNLKSEFEDGNLVQMHVTDESTFERDLIAANRSGLGKELLFDALTVTKPLNGPKLRQETGGGAIDVEKFFGEIESYKAEFSFNLVELLRQRPGQLLVPTYIAKAFAFIAGG